MSLIWKVFCLGVLQAIFVSTVTAQILQNIPVSQIKNMQQMQPIPYNQPANQQQPAINNIITALANTVPIIDKLGAIANVLQKMPAKPACDRRQNMAEALRQSALESLMVAANACKCNTCSRPEGMIPVPNQQLTVGSDVIGNRAVKVKYF